MALFFNSASLHSRALAALAKNEDSDKVNTRAYKDYINKQLGVIAGLGFFELSMFPNINIKGQYSPDLFQITSTFGNRTHISEHKKIGLDSASSSNINLNNWNMDVEYFCELFHAPIHGKLHISVDPNDIITISWLSN